MYVQCTGADEEHLDGFTALPDPHKVNNQPLLYCYVPDGDWAKRMCNLWGPFARDLGFYGIHWDTLGERRGLQRDSYLNFLKVCRLSYFYRVLFEYDY